MRHNDLIRVKPAAAASLAAAGKAALAPHRSLSAIFRSPGGRVPGGRVPGGRVPGGRVPGGCVPGGCVPGRPGLLVVTVTACRTAETSAGPVTHMAPAAVLAALERN